MSDPVPLSFERHGQMKLNDVKDYRAFRSRHLLPVVFQEFYGLATEFPLVFVRSSDEGEFVPVAMMGLSKGRNLYCQTEHWEPAFVPTGFTVGPLAVARLNNGKEEAIITVDESSALISDSKGEAMFTAHGKRTDFLQKRIEHVLTVTRQTLQARAVCQFLAEQRLFKARAFKLQYAPNSPRYEVEGVYIIDEEKLESLADESYLVLRQRGLIPLIYAHLTSLQQLGRLTRLQAEADQEAALQSA